MSTIEDFLRHPIATLERALHIRKQIAELQKELTALFGVHPPSIAGVQLLAPTRKGKRKMSAEARAKIAEAQKLRWARSKGFEPAEPAAPERAATKTKRGKGKISAEGRAKIIAAQKKRWAKAKAAKSSLDVEAPAKAAAGGKKKKRKLSPEARARIVAAVKKRWAKAKNGKK